MTPLSAPTSTPTPWWGIIPFVVMLLAIALLPLIRSTAHAWEKNRNKLLLALVLGIPVALWMAVDHGVLHVTHALWEYVSFIMLLLSLFTVSGGIYLSGDLRATPRNNTVILGIGAIVASFIGTTGASMLLIRPLLRANSERHHIKHTVVFFIFTVSNCGGLLTPLGDPPLFLGLLRGVPFMWTFTLFPEWLLVNGLLLATYYALDRRNYESESRDDLALDAATATPLRVHGAFNMIYLAMIVAAVALAPSINIDKLAEGTATLAEAVPWRELIMLAATVLSFVTGDKVARFKGNQFSWGPILEVAALFIGIFLTMMPALLFLKEVAPKLPLNTIGFYLSAGSLSSVLDNAPTYATFFEIARALGPSVGGELVAGVPVMFLTAISLGSVFFGAMTYVGNGPNFMVKAVAEHSGIEMPHFGGYVVWAFRYLFPILIANMLVFLAGGIWTWVGVALGVALLGQALWLRRSAAPVPEEHKRIHVDD
nr:sodium:proton antiporter [Propionibacterium sp.]